MPASADTLGIFGNHQIDRGSRRDSAGPLHVEIRFGFVARFRAQNAGVGSIQNNIAAAEICGEPEKAAKRGDVRNVDVRVLHDRDGYAGAVRSCQPAGCRFSQNHPARRRSKEAFRLFRTPQT